MAAKGLIRITWLCGRPIKCDNSLKCCWELMSNLNVIVTRTRTWTFSSFTLQLMLFIQVGTFDH